MQLAASARDVSAAVKSLCEETNKRAHNYLQYSTYELTSRAKGTGTPVAVLQTLPDTAEEVHALVRDKGVRTVDLNHTGPISLEANAVLCEFLRTTKELTTLRVRGIFDVKGQAEYSGSLYQKTIAAFDDKIQEKEDVLVEVMNEVSKAMGVPANTEMTVSNYTQTLQYLAKTQLDRVSNFLHALAQNKSITELDMGANALGTSNNATIFCTKLAQILDENEVILRLDISDNSLGMTNAGILCKGLTKNVKLVMINLSGNGLLKEGAEAAASGEENSDETVFGPLQPGLEALSEVLRKNKFLQQIVVRENDILAEGVTCPLQEDMGKDTPLFKFIEPLKKYHRLTVLDLASNSLADGGVALVADTLRYNKSVTTLNLSDNGFTFEGLRALAPLLTANVVKRLLLRKNSKLCLLDTHQAATTSAAKKVGKKRLANSQACVKEFCLALTSNTSLVELDFNACKMGGMIVRDIAEALGGRSTTMERVDVSGCNAGAVGEEVSVPMLQSLLEKARQLDFAWNFLDLPSFMKVVESGSWSTCQQLNVSRCGLNHELTKAHTEKFRIPMDVLTTLDLSFNTEQALQRNLIESIVQGGETLSLTSLSLASTSLSDDALCSLMRSAWALRKCRTLDVSGNLFTDDVVPDLVTFLADATALECLRMGGTSLTLENGLKKVLTYVKDGVSFGKQLTTLELWSNHMPSTSHGEILACCLEALLVNNPSIASLELNVSPIGATPEVLKSQRSLQNALMINAVGL